MLCLFSTFRDILSKERWNLIDMRKIIPRILLYFIVIVFIIFEVNLATSGDFTESERIVISSDVRWAAFDQNTSIKIFVKDKVIDGCWTSIDATKNAIELELSQNGIRISHDDNKHKPEYILVISGVGYEQNHNNQCIIYYSMEIASNIISLYKLYGIEVSGVTYANLWSESRLLAITKSKANVKLKERFVELAQRFLVDLLKNRRETRQQFFDAYKRKLGLPTDK